MDDGETKTAKSDQQKRAPQQTGKSMKERRWKDHPKILS